MSGCPFSLSQGRAIPDRQQSCGTSGEAVHGIAESDPALRQRRGRGDSGGLPERGGHGEACGRVGMAFPRGLLRGRGDRRQEAYRASDAVIRIENLKK